MSVVEEVWGGVGFGGLGFGGRRGKGGEGPEGGQCWAGIRAGHNKSSDLCPRTFSTSSSISAVESIRATAMLALFFFLASSGSESSSESNSSA